MMECQPFFLRIWKDGFEYENHESPYLKYFVECHMVEYVNLIRLYYKYI